MYQQTNCHFIHVTHVINGKKSFSYKNPFSLHLRHKRLVLLAASLHLFWNRLMVTNNDKTIQYNLMKKHKYLKDL